MKPSHEVIDRFADIGLRLCATLEAMLREDTVHRTVRRGCGYTQATRFLAARINEPRALDTFDDLSLFQNWRDRTADIRLRQALRAGTITSWRNWDLDPPASLATIPGDDPARELILEESERQTLLRNIPSSLDREESRLIATLIRDIVLPGDNGQPMPSINAWPSRLQVGSCPTAEKCFLELAHGFIPRKGICNLLVDERGEAVMVEKINMGDNHSCISLAPFVINKVRIPPGSLVAVCYDAKSISSMPGHGPFPGKTVPLNECKGVRMLRLTTLAVSPENRARAFSTHFEAQVTEGLFEPGQTSLDQLRRIVSRDQTYSPALCKSSVGR